MVRFMSALAGCLVGSTLLAAPAHATAVDRSRPAVQRLAQARDAATCARWRADIRTRIDGFNRSCSGPLDANQTAACAAVKRRLDDEISQFNSQCSG